MKNKLFSNDVIISICIAGIFLSLILITNFIFDLFKVWAYSIQVFLIIYAIGIYKIKNLFVNVFFLLITPLILFFIENSAYVINGMQVFFEYFLTFYIFSLLYLLRWSNIFLKNKKNYQSIQIILFIVFFILLIFLKFFMHSLASMFWFGKNNFGAALIYNLLWLATNSLTIPILIIIIFPIFKLFDTLNKNQENKW
ncbi:hypothetical protein ACJA28_00175 [Mesomycoplasma moatsii]|uniref:hypothetical protein n=1 Tax=Mesomycoplasma moatsii TaxID=171287 RepID=UPI0003B516E5